MLFGPLVTLRIPTVSEELSREAPHMGPWGKACKILHGISSDPAMGDPTIDDPGRGVHDCVILGGGSESGRLANASVHGISCQRKPLLAPANACHTNPM